MIEKALGAVAVEGSSLEQDCGDGGRKWDNGNNSPLFFPCPSIFYYSLLLALRDIRAYGALAMRSMGVSLWDTEREERVRH